jgi:2-polyprenyl-3-methyl-5-hydroxy-6-metoxy-1,4-benzoquinol methylase
MIDEHHYSEHRNKRVKKTAEVFTPLELVDKILDNMDVNWSNPPEDKTFLDPTCGSGNFLVQIAKRGIPVHNLYGVDLMEDNVIKTKERLRDIYGDTEDVNFHLDRNIIQADAMEYSYDFWKDNDEI